jgi:hypothetical protein
MPYRHTIDVALDRLQILVERRQQIDNQIHRLKAVVTANAAMLPSAQQTEIMNSLLELVGTARGFTNAVREFMRRNSEESFTATAVRDGLTTVNFDVREYDNPLASIHTILKRLHTRGEVDRNPVDGSYRWRRG